MLRTQKKKSFILLYKMKGGNKGGLNFGSKYKKRQPWASPEQEGNFLCVEALLHCIYKVQDEWASITPNSCAFLSQSDGVALLTENLQ